MQIVPIISLVASGLFALAPVAWRWWIGAKARELEELAAGEVGTTQSAVMLDITMRVEGLRERKAANYLHEAGRGVFDAPANLLTMTVDRRPSVIRNLWKIGNMR